MPVIGRRHQRPTFGKYPVADIREPQVRRWRRELEPPCQPFQRPSRRQGIGHEAGGMGDDLFGDTNHRRIQACGFPLARLEGLEPPTGCLEDRAWLSGNVLHLGFAVLGVCWDAPGARACWCRLWVSGSRRLPLDANYRRRGRWWSCPRRAPLLGVGCDCPKRGMVAARSCCTSIHRRDLRKIGGCRDTT
jgi:hypothetical protein